MADNSSKSPTTDAECAAGVHSCTIMCDYSENQICNLRLSRTQFLTTQLSANRLPDKLPIGHRKVTNSFLKQTFSTDWNRAINPINKTVSDIHLGCRADNDTIGLTKIIKIAKSILGHEVN